eukprot:5844630-Heterocapsa_arctica.AAC.1
MALRGLPDDFALFVPDLCTECNERSIFCAIYDLVDVDDKGAPAASGSPRRGLSWAASTEPTGTNARLRSCVPKLRLSASSARTPTQRTNLELLFARASQGCGRPRSTADECTCSCGLSAAIAVAIILAVARVRGRPLCSP